MGQYFKKKIWSFSFILTLVLPSLLSIFIRDMTNEGENRILAKMPVLSLNTIRSFPGEYEDYYNDHAPFRNGIINLNNRIKYYVLKDSPNDKVVLGKAGWMYLRQDQITSYKRTNRYSEHTLEIAAKYWQNIYDYCKQDGAELIILIAPDKAEIYPEGLPKYIKRYSEKPNQAEQFSSFLNENTDVKVIYPKTAILEAKESMPDENVYYPLDSHWNQIGAYIGTRELARVIDDISLPDISELSISRGKSVNFGIPGMIGINDIRPLGYDYVVEGYNQGSRIVCYDDPRGNNVRIKSENSRSDKKILFLRDSFFTAMEPYLATCYEEIYAPHYTLNYNSAMIEQEKPDYVVIEVVERALDVFTYLEVIPEQEESVWDIFRPTIDSIYEE